jgi:hypothetical protein
VRLLCFGVFRWGCCVGFLFWALLLGADITDVFLLQLLFLVGGFLGGWLIDFL